MYVFNGAVFSGLVLVFLVIRQQNKSFSVLPAAEFSEVESDFHAKVPAVFCREVCRCLLSSHPPLVNNICINSQSKTMTYLAMHTPHVCAPKQSLWISDYIHSNSLGYLWLFHFVASLKPGFFCSGLLCKVTTGNDVACLTTNHLAALAKLEPRLVPLVLAFRHWARVKAPSAGRQTRCSDCFS